MKHSPFTALYDANVLYPAPLRDFLMNLALTGVYRARWSANIHEEWKRNLLLNRPDLSCDQVQRLGNRHVQSQGFPRHCAWQIRYLTTPS